MSKWHYGGQALLEGVMIRGRTTMTIAVRSPQGEIVLHDEPLEPPTGPWARWPFLRGLCSLWDTLKLGMRALNYSANVALGEGEYRVGGGQMAVILVVAVAIAVGLFFLLPQYLSSLVRPAVASPWLQVLLEGLIRLALVLGYFLAIAQLRDLKRVFAYHGAEHKAVNAFEAGAALDVAGVRPFSTAHTRCGTAFVLLVVVISIPLFAPLGWLPHLALKMGARILLVPFLAAVSYEVMRLAAGHFDRPIVRALLAPALLLQRITTREPNDAMIEVAIAALRRAVALDEQAVAERSTQPESN